MNSQDLGLLRQALPYIKHHRGRTFVVKCGGEIARDAAALDSLANDLALCVLMASIRVVLVHGGGPQASELSERLGMEPRKIAGRRITDEATLEVAKMVFGGSINTDILSALRRHDLRAVGLSGVDAGIVQAVRRPTTEVNDPATGETQLVDWGLVGDIQSVDTELLRYLLDGRYLPVMSSLGGDDLGNVYNINADTVAGEIAVNLKADKLILLTDEVGLLKDRADPATLISHITTQRCRELIAGGAVTGGMVPKLETIIRAVDGGVPRAHILHGKRCSALLEELFTKQGTGTMITTRDEEKRYLVE